MRASSMAVVLSGTVLLAVGCSQSASPTSPASVPSAGASSTSSSVAAEHEVPFKGTLQGADTDSNPTATSIDVTTDGAGTATHLGRFSVRQVVTVCFAGNCANTSVGTSHWVAADGDSFDTTIAGSGEATAPGEFRIIDKHTITGGTGRFAGAKGSFTVDRVASAITFTTSGSFEGTMTSPGAND